MYDLFAKHRRSAKMTRCSAIAARPRCRVRYGFGQKWKTGTGRSIFNHCDI